MTPLLAPAVAAFLEHEGASAPDFSGCLVLVPHHHAALAFQRALSDALPNRHLRPPRLLTLPELAAQAPASEAPEADSVRLAQLHDFLARTGQVPSEALWDAARELLVLVNDLDGQDAGATVFADLARSTNHYLSTEAGIAQAVWQALASTGAPGRLRLHARRLNWLAERADRPLYTLGLTTLTEVEKAFISHWATRMPVADLPTPARYPDREALLLAVWEEKEPPLHARARQLAETCPASPMTGQVTLVAAPGLETAARSAERILLDWLAAGRRNIALIALDRLMARRLRALLERRGILVQDETGWAFSTASASHVVECWLRLVSGGAWYGDLLDFLKSPFVFADQATLRLRAAHELDEAFRRHRPPDSLAGHLELAHRDGLHAAQALLRRIQRASAPFGQSRLPLGEWCRRLLGARAELAVDGPLAADPVGRQLLRLLERLAAESAGHGMRYSLADWRRWLFLHLEQSTFLDDTVASPIRLTHLAAAHTRELEGALFLGVGAAHLPGPAPAGLFNDAARQQLGLPGAAARETALRSALANVLARVPAAALVWQAQEQGDPAPLSPWLVHLDAFHRAAWGQSLVEPHADWSPVVGEDPAPAPELLPPAATRVPERLSVSAWQSMVACPYQFFARHLLKLNERDEVPEEMGKADYGSLVHRVLAEFHAQHPILENEPAEILEARLRDLGRQVFASAEAEDYLASAWRQRWERQLPAYVTWAMTREREGYRFRSAETPLAREVEWRAGSTTQVHGRIDRIDGCGDATALLDYKTQSTQTLRNKLAVEGEDVQLSAYAWLADAGDAAFVTLDDNKVGTIAWLGSLPDAAAAEGRRLHDVLAGLGAGAPLPSQGAPATCSHCEMRGLCRREHQEATQA